jgi:hypothetical protein
MIHAAGRRPRHITDPAPRGVAWHGLGPCQAESNREQQSITIHLCVPVRQNVDRHSNYILAAFMTSGT